MFVSDDILKFWFSEIPNSAWWTKNPDFDSEIRERFLPCYRSVAAGECYQWRESPEGSLAEVIVLDQFPRNMFRDQPEAFAYDSLALVLAQVAISKGFDAQLESPKKSFLYMPFMHSESKKIHIWAEKLFRVAKLSSLDFELKHKQIIDRFGRYPHRNKVLGRESTPEEIEFLKGPDSSF